MLKLSAIASKLEEVTDDWTIYFNKKTEEFISIPDQPEIYDNIEKEDYDEIDESNDYIRFLANMTSMSTVL